MLEAVRKINLRYLDIKKKMFCDVRFIHMGVTNEEQKY